MAAPYSQHVYALGAIMILNGIAIGYVDAGSNAYLLVLWQCHKAKDSVIQTRHFLWSVGSAIGPLIITPFLSDRPQDEYLNGTLGDIGNETDVMDLWLMFTNSTSNNVMEPNIVGLAYLVVGLFPLVSSLLFAVLFTGYGATCAKVVKLIPRSAQIHQSQDHTRRCFKSGLLFYLFIFFALYLICEKTPGTFLSTFAVKGFDWSLTFGALILSVLWISQGTGRLLGIPLSYCLSPSLVIAICFILVCSGSILMLVVPLLGKVCLIVSVVLVGLGIGPMFGAKICWASNYIDFAGFVAGVCYVGCSIGSILSMLIDAYTIDTFHHMWMVYILLGSSVLSAVLFAVMNVLVKCMNKNQTKFHAVGQNIEMGS